MDTKRHTAVGFSVLFLRKCRFLFYLFFSFVWCLSLWGEGQDILRLCAADFDLENQVEPIKTKSVMVNIQRQEQQNISPEGNLP